MTMQRHDSTDLIRVERLRRLNRLRLSRRTRNDSRPRRNFGRAQRTSDLRDVVRLAQNTVRDTARRPLRKPGLTENGVLDEGAKLLTR